MLTWAKDHDPEWYPMLVFGFRTGLRQGEIRALKWDDVDLVAGKVTVKSSLWRNIEGSTKSRRVRTVPLTAAVREALKAHRHLRGPYVFSQEDGRPLTQTMVRSPLWRACRRAGLRRIGVHVMRHTFASHLMMRGVPLATLQAYLGHSTIQMTMRYAHHAPDVRDSAIAVLDLPASTTGAVMGMQAKAEG